MTIQEKIHKLCIEYYGLINQDHHKDRDCHFYIQTVISCYEPFIKYYFHHDGYINEKYGEDRTTYKEAEDDLLRYLIYIVNKETKFNKENADQSPI